ncbi:MAG TPA: putative Ig domain-containing protein, partial [Bryobacteraceae bacterium]
MWLWINGSFNVSETNVVSWNDPRTGTEVVIGPGTGLVSAFGGNLIADIPRALFANTAGTPVSVAIRVRQTTGTVRTSNTLFVTIEAPLGNPPGHPIMPAAATGASYSAPLFVGGSPFLDTPEFIISVQAGALPPGLVLPDTGRNLSGTATTPGLYTFGVTITDAWDNSFFETENLLVVNNATITQVSPNQTIFGGSTLQIDVLGQNFITSTSVAGAAAPIPGSIVLFRPANSTPIPLATQYVSANRLTATIPANLIAQAQLALISVRQPSQVESNALPFNVVEPIPPLQFTTASLPNGIVGVQYGAAFQGSGGKPDYSFFLDTGSLPPGLTLARNGILSGTPTTAGDYRFAVVLADATGGTIVKSFSLTITPAPLTLNGSVSDVAAGASINTKFTATGGVPGYTFSSSGSLPTGTTLASDGTLSGTATTPGSYTFTITVTDKAGSTASRTFTIKVSPAALTITTESLPSGAVGVDYTADVSATGGVPPYTFSATGAPPGVSFANGKFSGKPTTEGQNSVSVTVTDSQGTKASRTFSVVIAAAPLTITTDTLP